MEKGRLAIKQRAAALEAAEAARRFQQETLGEQAEEAGGPNVTRFVEQLSGRVRTHCSCQVPCVEPGCQEPWQVHTWQIVDTVPDFLCMQTFVFPAKYLTQGVSEGVGHIYG